MNNVNLNMTPRHLNMHYNKAKDTFRLDGTTNNKWQEKTKNGVECCTSHDLNTSAH